MDTTATTETDDDLMSVYLRHWKALCAHLKKRTGSRELAEDALQETWLRLAGMKDDAAVIHDHHAFILRVAGNNRDRSRPKGAASYGSLRQRRDAARRGGR